MPKPYIVNPEKRETFSILFLLDLVENSGLGLPVLLEGDYALLDALVRTAYNRGLLEIQGVWYTNTPKGRNALTVFMKRYSDFLASYDVFCAVDLSQGAFGFAEYWNMTEARFKEYLEEDRWEDLRVAVIEYKNRLSLREPKIDPIEIIFMSFLNEGRFDYNKPGWQFEVALGTAWDEMARIASTLLQPEDLGYEGVAWESVIRDVIEQGTAVLIALTTEENRLRAAGDISPVESEPDRIVVTVVTEVTYWDDPYFVYPWWYDPYW